MREKKSSESFTKLGNTPARCVKSSPDGCSMPGRRVPRTYQIYVESFRGRRVSPDGKRPGLVDAAMATATTGRAKKRGRSTRSC